MLVQESSTRSALGHTVEETPSMAICAFNRRDAVSHQVVQAGEMAVAKDCIDAYFHSARKYTAKGDAEDGHGVTRVRAIYAQADILAHAAHGCKGADLCVGIQIAFKQIQEGLALAKGSARYAPLLYMGTVHFWRAALPLMRSGTWQHMQQPLAAVVALLVALPGYPAWKARLTGALGQCLGEVRKQNVRLLLGIITECNAYLKTIHSSRVFNCASVSRPR